jgi:putative cardiolipin synthase
VEAVRRRLKRFAWFVVSLGRMTAPPIRPDLPAESASPFCPESSLGSWEGQVRSWLGEDRAGVLGVQNPAEALHWRLALLDEAHHSVDAQYYLWEADHVGYLMISRVLHAADRGVRVRLLVDDVDQAPSTTSIAALNLHPNVDIRVFNPWATRRKGVLHSLEFALGFRTLNQRMHNKLLVADNAAAIVGGRNIGNAYYGLDETSNLVDFDSVLTGPVVRQLSNVFDTYWNGPAAHPGSSLHATVTPDDLDATRSLIGGELAARASRLNSFPLERIDWTDRMSSAITRMSSASVSVSHDIPGDYLQAPAEQVATSLVEVAEQVRDELVIATPFFVPTDADVAWYRTVVGRGVTVRLLTNSLATNPAPISNAGLRKRRRDVVEAGVELYELRADAAAKPVWETPPTESRRLGLHAKLYVIDRRRLFVGSLNLDPRSLVINTEFGVILDDPAIADSVGAMIERLTEADNAWKVSVDDGTVSWTNDDRTTNRQPARGRTQLGLDWLLSRIPIEHQI